MRAPYFLQTPLSMRSLKISFLFIWIAASFQIGLSSALSMDNTKSDDSNISASLISLFSVRGLITQCGDENCDDANKKDDADGFEKEEDGESSSIGFKIVKEQKNRSAIHLIQSMNNSLCVKGKHELRNAVANSNLKNSTISSFITICTERIDFGFEKEGKLGLIEDPNDSIDVSNRNIIIDCVVSIPYQRCVLNGNGISRIFTGSNANITLKNLALNDGRHVSLGGAIKIEEDSIITLINCSFFNNSVNRNGKKSMRGGAMIATDSVVAINKCDFSNNYIGETDMDDDIDYTIDYKDYGGALMVNHSRVTIQESMFSNNIIYERYGRGGAIYAEDSRVTIQESTFSNNECVSNGRGGVIFAEDSDMIIDGLVPTLFFTNVADSGGAVYCSRGNVSFANVEFIKNYASYRAGALYLENVAAPSLEKTSFLENSGKFSGAFSIYDSQQLSMSNIIFRDNFSGFRHYADMFGCKNVTMSNIIAINNSNIGAFTCTGFQISYSDTVNIYDSIFSDEVLCITGVTSVTPGRFFYPGLVDLLNIVSTNLQNVTLKKLDGINWLCDMGLLSIGSLSMSCVNYGRTDQIQLIDLRKRTLMELADIPQEHSPESNHASMAIRRPIGYNSISLENAARRVQSSNKCVTTSSALENAVSSAGTGTTRITICTKKITIGKHGRRLSNSSSRLLQSNQTGIDISNKNIQFDCHLPSLPNTRCILDGLGKSRIFYGFNSNITFEKIMFRNGSANKYDFDGTGGALMIRNSSVRINQCGFFHNKAIFGGAVSIMNSEMIVNDGSTNFMNNSSLRRTIFAFNEASESGGALDLRELQNSAFKNTIFRSNRATDLGGAFRALKLTLAMDNVQIDRNKASSGGGLHVEEANIKLSNSYLIRNNGSATGAFRILNSYVELTNSSVTNNTGDEASVVMFSCTGYLNNVNFTNNNMPQVGGTVTISDSVIDLFNVKFDKHVNTQVNQTSKKCDVANVYDESDFESCLNILD